MTTIFDWATVILFSGIAVLFLHRSAGASSREDSMLSYLPPVIGCAVANQLGNKGAELWAGLLIVATVVYVVAVLKPFPRQS